LGTVDLDDLLAADIAQWQILIADMGTVDWIEQMIDRRLTCAVGSPRAAAPGGDARQAVVAVVRAHAERAA
jgi:geranylgeranyl diphosphate synthase type I